MKPNEKQEEFIAPSRPIELISGKEVFRYDSISALSSSLSIGMSKLIGHIRRGRGDVHGMWLEFRLVEESVEERIRREIADAERREKQGDFKKRLIDASKFRTNIKRVEVISSDGTAKRYDSVTECAKDIGVSVSGIGYAIKHSDGYMPKKNLTARFLDEK